MKVISDFSIDTEILTENTVEGTKRMYISGPFLMHSKENRNGRIYSKKGMDNAVKRYTEDYIKTNRALGELNHPCFDETANVFVEGKGLISIKAVQVGDFVIGTNEKNESIRSKVLDVTRNHFTGNLLKFSSRSFRATVTPYHRFYVMNRNGYFDVVTAGEIKEKYDSGDRSLSHSYIPITMENWVDGIDEEYIMFKQRIPRLSNPSHAYAVEPLSIRYKDFCAFMGIYLSEGCLKYYTRQDKTQTPGEIQITQNVGTNLDIIIDLVSRLGVNKWSVRYTRDNIKATVVIADIRLADYLQQFGDCYQKFVPDEILQTTKENIREFLDWFQLGDGSSRTIIQESKNQIGEYTQNDVFTVSEKMANGLIECILKCGKSTTKRIQLSAKDYIFADRLIKVENKSPLFRMTIGNSKGKYVDDRFMNIEEVPHDGDVFCLVTETSNFYVEQHNTCFLTGNCSRLQIDPERACIMTTELKPDGNYYHGKAKVLSTPLGKLLESLLADGVKIGVSSRGVGSVTKQGGKTYVGEDFILSTCSDVVTEPSVAEAMVEPLMEGKEYEFMNGVLVEKDYIDYVAAKKKMKSKEFQEYQLKKFENLINRIK